uniref:Uncharacterized protein n=1 Tax=Glossina pallidipes TaxID=7398 RepID=A0A1A9Z4P4_GLOPL
MYYVSACIMTSVGAALIMRDMLFPLTNLLSTLPSCGNKPLPLGTIPFNLFIFKVGAFQLSYTENIDRSSEKAPASCQNHIIEDLFSSIDNLLNFFKTKITEWILLLFQTDGIDFNILLNNNFFLIEIPRIVHIFGIV